MKINHWTPSEALSKRYYYNIHHTVLTSLACSFNERHKVPNLNEVGLLFNLAILVDLSVLAHAEEQFVPVVDNLFDIEGLMVHHEWIARVVYHHVLG